MSTEPPEPADLVNDGARGVEQGDREYDPAEPLVWLWGPDPAHRSWAGQGWVAFDAAGIAWLRDVALPAMLAELEANP